MIWIILLGFAFVCAMAEYGVILGIFFVIASLAACFGIMGMFAPKNNNQNQKSASQHNYSNKKYSGGTGGMEALRYFEEHQSESTYIDSDGRTWDNVYYDDFGDGGYLGGGGFFDGGGFFGDD